MLLARAPCDLYMLQFFECVFAKYSTEQLSVTVPGRAHSQGCHGYHIHCGRALPGSTNLVSTSTQAHLLVMNLCLTYINIINEQAVIIQDYYTNLMVKVAVFSI